MECIRRDGWIDGWMREGKSRAMEREREVRVWLSESSCIEDTVGGSGRVVGELRV